MIIAPWGLTVKPGATYKYEIPPFANLKISNAALGAELEDKHSRTTLTIETEDRPPTDSEDEDELAEDDNNPRLTNIVLTSLTPGKIEQSIHDITFSFPALLKIKATGKNTIHLGGNLLAEPQTDDSDSEDGFFDYEDADGLDELGSDIELQPGAASSDGGRFEEIYDVLPAKAGQKRPREDDMDEDDDEVEAKQGAPTKSQKKKLNKKLKVKDGEAVPVGAPSTEKKEKEKENAPESSPESSKKESKDKNKEHKKEKKEKKKDEKKEKKPEQTGGAPTASTSADSPSNKKTLANGLVIEDSKVGSGKTAKAGSNCSMRYIGKLANGTIFDSNTKGQPFSFKLGIGQVIKGWDQGIVGMQEGGERVITVPPALAYGNKKQGSIPANSTLKFEVKLLSTK